MSPIRNIIVLSLVLGVTLLFNACESNTGSDDSNDFDRTAMLKNYGQNIILPSYEQFQSAVDELNDAVVDFSDTPTVANLELLQSKLKTARLTWQKVNLFQFGPAEMQILRTSVNTFPANVDQIYSNIESGDYILGTLENQAAAGLPTLGYLLHGLGESNEQIVSAYTTDQFADNRLNYLEDNISFIKGKTDAVVAEWSSSGGDYIGMFLSEKNTGTDVGSSTGMLVNALIKHYERFLRDGKIGIPAGVRSAGVPRPSATEAYYAGYSVELAIANMEAVRTYFLGVSATNSEIDGIGLQEHLQGLEADDLAATIETELNESITALEGLNDPLSNQIESNNDPVLSAFQEMQDVIVLMKADMASVLGVTITFQDNDGD